MISPVEYRETPPRADLRRHIACLWRLNGGTADPDAGTVVPDGCVELVLALGDDVAAPDGRRLRRFVVGQQLSRTQLTYRGDVDLLCVRLRASGAFPLFGDAAPALAGRIEALDSIAPDLDRALESAGPNRVERILSDRLASR